jgi:hypothetical protein
VPTAQGTRRSGGVALLIAALLIGVVASHMGFGGDRPSGAKPTPAPGKYWVKVEIGYPLGTSLEPSTTKKTFTVNGTPAKFSSNIRAPKEGAQYWKLWDGKAGPYTTKPTVRVTIWVPRPEVMVRCKIWINGDLKDQQSHPGDTACNA